MTVERQREDRWLTELVGEWRYEMQAEMGPGDAPVRQTGTERVRTIDGLWVLCEAVGDEASDGASGGAPQASLLTLGYDPARGRVVGTFVGATMTHLWLYEGTLDAEGRALTLDTEGPGLRDGTIARYQDVLERRDADHRVMTSHVQAVVGTWTLFMTSTYERVR